MAIMVASFRDSVDEWLSADPAGRSLPARRHGAEAAISSTPRCRRASPPCRRAAGAVSRVTTACARRRAGARGAARAAGCRPTAANCRWSAGVARTAGGRPAHLDFGSRARSPRLASRRSAVELPLAGQARAGCASPASGATMRGRTARVMIDLADYRRLTGDRLANDAAISLAPGAAPTQVADGAARHWPRTRRRSKSPSRRRSARSACASSTAPLPSPICWKRWRC